MCANMCPTRPQREKSSKTDHGHRAGGSATVAAALVVLGTTAVVSAQVEQLTALFPIPGRQSVAPAGDVNNDQIPDIISGDHQYGGAYKGRAWVTSGADGSDLWVFDPPPGSEMMLMGYSVCGIADLNNDDHDDVVASMYGNSQVFIYSGLDGTVLHTFEGYGGGFGFEVANVGDVNRDGTNDLFISNQAGKAYVFSGADFSQLYEFAIGNFEIDAAGAGDVNYDNYPDIIIGKPHFSDIDRNRGRVIVYSGLDGSELYSIDGPEQDALFGNGVDTAGDINFDGYADFVVGTMYNGQVWVYSGIDGSVIYHWNEGSRDWFGQHVAGGADIDGDRIPDILVAAANAGMTYTYSGRTGERIFECSGGNAVAASPDLTDDGIGEVLTNSSAYAGQRKYGEFFGPVPGLAGTMNTFQVADVIPGNTVYLVYGFRDGQTHVPGCPPEVVVKIALPQIAATAVADEYGVAVLGIKVPMAANGRTILFQAAIPASCRVTPLTRHTFRTDLPSVLYVDDSAGVGGTGWSWASAFNKVDAAVQSGVDLGTVSEVWVAQGTYVETVNMANGIALYGGFVGNENNRNDRNPDVNISDLNGNDRFAPVVRAHAVDETAVLDGFHVSHGKSSNNPEAAGIDIAGASPTIMHCVIEHHYGDSRVGMEVRGDGSSPYVFDVLFTNNECTGYGAGGVNVFGGTPYFEQCDFIGNSAQNHSGAVNVQTGNAVFDSCMFRNNEVYNAYDQGGGAFFLCCGGQSTIIDSILVGNEVRSWLGTVGGAVYIDRGSSTVNIINSIVAGNKADSGSAVYNQGHCNITNSIVWSNTLYTGQYGTTSVTWSDTEKSHGGEGNISANPMFVDPYGGDFRLLPGSPCIDAGNNTAFPDWILFDFGGQPRFVDDPDTPDTGFGDPPIIDIGPHEYQP